MKTLRLTLFSLLGASLFLFANSVAAQVSESGSQTDKEIILGIPKLTDKNVNIVIDAIKQVEGLKFEQYCPGHQIILIKYSSELFATREKVVTALEEKNVTMQMVIKEGEFKDVQDLCN